MMIAAGSGALYTVLKEPLSNDGNQFVRVSTNESLHDALSEMMGSRGLVSFNQRIIFIEGEESSADRHLYEHFYPPGKYNVSFVPAGNSATVRNTAEKVDQLLSSGIGFQQYYSIVDGDIERATDPPPGGRLFKLPVYHVENFLLNEQVIFETTKDILAEACPYTNSSEIKDELIKLLLSDEHLKPFTKALLDTKVANVAKAAWDAVYAKTTNDSLNLQKPQFHAVEAEAKRLMEKSIQESNWKTFCKGRALISAYCAKHGLKYEHFRNLLVNRMTEPPDELKTIMDKIL